MHHGQVVSVGDIRLRSWGEGPALVFCHGFTTTSEFWREQVEPFSKHHQVICVNLPGHGISPAPPDRAYTMEAFVRDLEGVFDALHIEDAVLVGLSMGGTIAQRFALRDASGVRGAARLRALVLVGATSHGLGADVDATNVVANIRRLGVEAASQGVIDRSFGHDAPEALLKFARAEVAQTPAHVAEQAVVSLNQSDTRQQLRNVSLPTLVVCGEEDIITPPAESQALANGIPGAKLCLVPRAGHFPMLERPAVFNEALRTFLTTLDRA